MTEVWILNIKELESKIPLSQLLKILPKTLHNKALRYINTSDAFSYVGGRLLLKNIINKRGYPNSLLEEISYSEGGKPNLKNYNFSISHSNRYVTLIFGTTSSLGIDIEKKEKPKLDLFSYLFRTDEWKSITMAKTPHEKFYWYWVRKEALLKVVDCSLKDLKELDVFEQYGIYKKKEYYFKPFDLDPEFNAIVAMEKKEDFSINYLNLIEIMNL